MQPLDKWLLALGQIASVALIGYAIAGIAGNIAPSATPWTWELPIALPTAFLLKGAGIILFFITKAID